MNATSDSVLSDPQRVIADLQRQLAERTAERDEALEQQAAAAEILRVVSSSPSDVQPTFDAIAAAAVTLTHAAMACVVTYDGKLAHLASLSGVAPDEIKRTRDLFPIPVDLGTVMGRAIVRREIVHVDDLSTDPEHRYPVHAQASGRTVLAVPMLRDGVPIGGINVHRHRVEPFTESQISLFKTFADQAVIAIENARLIAETREALDQQTATAEVLGVINSSPGDLAPVFDATLEKAMRLCEAKFGALNSYDGEKTTALAMRGLPPEVVALYREPFVPRPGGMFGRIIRGEPLVHVPDLSADEALLSANPRARALLDLGGVRTALELPLRKDEALVGSMWFYRQEARPFTDKQIALLQNFAAQAVIAMENARLITETREALEQQTATAEVLQVINASPGDLTPVFDKIVERAMELCGAAFGTMVVAESEQFRTVSARAVPAEYADFRRRNPVPPGHQGIAAAIRAGEPIVHTLDLKDTDLYRSGDDRRRALVDLGGTRTCLVANLTKDADVLGAIQIYRQEVRPFSESDITVLQNFAAQAVIAMENARLLGELRQRTEEVAELNRGLEARVAEQVDELGRVGRLKRFLAPQLAEMIVSHGDESILESHRREIVVVFCDLRGYTAFTETAEPEEVLDFLREYHGALGPLVSQFEGTLDQFSGDGIMVFFNDPVPIPDPAERAVKMAVAMREAAGSLIAQWRRRDRDLGFGAGIAQGYATLGQIGFSERSGYTAIGTVCNLAARLCAEAKDGQILITGRVAAAAENAIQLEDLGSLSLRGLSQPVSTFNVPLTASQPALRVIEGGPASD